MAILINIIGLLLIAFIIWWFWIYKAKDEKIAGDDVVTVEVADGLYKPDTIRTEKDKTLTLRFLRKDPSPCAGTVVFADFDVNSELPINKPRDITITPTETGEFQFTCQMAMYRGKIIVE